VVVVVVLLRAARSDTRARASSTRPRKPPSRAAFVCQPPGPAPR